MAIDTIAKKVQDNTKSGKLPQINDAGKITNDPLSLLVKASDIGNQYLKGIEQNTRDMINAITSMPSSNSAPKPSKNPFSSPSSNIKPVIMNDNRSGYATSPYALA